jgi:phage minor structural protein
LSKQTAIALYPKDTTKFVGQGYGILADTYSATTTESAEENGNIKYELELTYPIDGPLADKLKDTNLIRVPVSVNTDAYQIFEIYDYLDDDAGTMTVYGQSLTYRLFNLPFDNGGNIVRSGGVNDVLNYAKSLVPQWPSGASLVTDIPDNIKVEDQFNNFGDFLNRLVAMVKGEVQYDNGVWKLLKKRGADSGITLRDDKNTVGLQIKYTYDEIINRVIPVWQNPDKGADESNKEIVGRPIISKDPFKYYGYWRGKTIKVDSQADTVGYFDKNPIDKPKITATIRPLLVDEDFDNVGLFDYVQIYNHRLKYLAKLQIITRQFDCLNREVTDFTVGSVERNIFVAQKQQQQEQQDETNKKIDDTKDTIDKETDKKIEESSKDDQEFALTSANGRSKNYYGDSQPTGNLQEGDMWFKGALSNGAVTMYKYVNGKWVELFPKGFDEKLRAEMEASDKETEAQIKAAGFANAQELFRAVSDNGKQIVSVKANFNGLQSTVTNNANNTSSRFTQMSNLFDSKITDTTNNLSSQITQKVNSIKLSTSGGYLYLNGSNVYLGGSNIRITGQTYIENGAINNAAIANLDAGKIVSGKIHAIDIQGSTISGGEIKGTTINGSTLSGSSTISLSAGGRTTMISGQYGISTPEFQLTNGGVAKFTGQVDSFGVINAGGRGLVADSIMYKGYELRDYILNQIRNNK